MTARKLAVFLLPAVWIVLVVIRVFDGEERKRQPLQFQSGRVAAAEGLDVTGPANVDGSADGDHGMPLTPKNIFAPLGTNPEALQTAAAIVPASRSGDAMARFGKKRAPLVSSRVPLRADV